MIRHYQDVAHNDHFPSRWQVTRPGSSTVDPPTAGVKGPPGPLARTTPSATSPQPPRRQLVCAPCPAIHDGLDEPREDNQHQHDPQQHDQRRPGRLDLEPAADAVENSGKEDGLRSGRLLALPGCSPCASTSTSDSEGTRPGSKNRPNVPLIVRLSTGSLAACSCRVVTIR